MEASLQSFSALDEYLCIILCNWLFLLNLFDMRVGNKLNLHLRCFLAIYLTDLVVIITARKRLGFIDLLSADFLLLFHTFLGFIIGFN